MTVIDLPIIDLDAGTTAAVPSRADSLRQTYLYLLGAIFLHVAGLLTQGDPEVYMEAEIALYSSLVLMLWCAIRIFQRAADDRRRALTAAGS